MLKLFNFFRSKYFWINVALAIVLTFIIVWFSFSMLDDYTHHGESITVPNLKGLTLTQIEEVLTSKNLKYEVNDSAYSTKIPPLAVIEQDPRPDSKVKVDRTIYLTVNAQNPPSVKMPKLKDVSLKQATLILESLGLKIGELIYKPDLAQNAVLDQQIKEKSIPPGTSLPKGTVIDLVLGNGLGNTQVEVPNLIGLTFEEAKFVLQGASLNMGAVIIDQGVTDTLQAKVYKQLPTYSFETQLNLGESVDIFLSN